MGESNFLSCGGLHLQPVRASFRTVSFHFRSRAQRAAHAGLSDSRPVEARCFPFSSFGSSFRVLLRSIGWTGWPLLVAPPAPPVGRRPSRIFDAHGWIFLRYLRLSA